MPTQAVKPYLADISFLQPVIDAYRLGVFDNKDLPGRVMNALDSLSWYGNVRIPYDYIEEATNPLHKMRTFKKPQKKGGTGKIKFVEREKKK